MRYCFIAPDFYPRIGGGENYVRYLAEHLAEDGNTVYVITPNALKRGTILLNKVAVIYSNFYIFFGNKFVKPWLLFYQLRRINPQVIYVSGPGIGDIFALLCSKILRKSIVTTYHADLNNEKFTSRLFVKSYCRLVAKHFDKIIVQNSLYRDLLHSRKIPYSKLYLVPPGVVMGASAKTSVALKKQNLLLFVGVLDRDHHYKNLDLLIDAMHFLPNFHLNIVGDGESRKLFENQAHDLQNINFLGQLTKPELDTAYDTASIFVLPSNSPAEGFGVVLVEALSHGCMIITGEAAGGSDLTTNAGELGMLYNGTVSDLINKIKKLENRQVSEEQLESILDLIGEYSWEHVARRINSICEQIANTT